MKFNPADLIEFTQNVLVAAGASSASAARMANILVWCNQAGLPNQGVWRLPIFCKNLAGGGIASKSSFSTQALTDNCLHIQAEGGFGHIYAEEAINLASETAQKQGIAAVAVSGSNFCGALSYYVYQAAEQKCMAFFFANSFPKVAAHGGMNAVLGTNPFAFSAPGENGKHLLLDMSTSMSAGSTVTKARETGDELPEGTTLSEKTGKPVLLPFGGAKGYGMSLMVELLAGVLSSAAFSTQLGSLYEDTSAQGENGQFAIAISVEQFMPFADYLDRFGTLRKLVSWEDNVRLPGEQKIANLKAAYNEPVELDKQTLDTLSQLAQDYQLSLSSTLG